MSKPKTAKRPPGRPRVEFDLQRVEDWGALGCTYQEMADLQGCNIATISDRMSDPESEFSKAYKRGLGSLKQSLRAAQVKLAKRGNATMLIWLGKQLLAQVDRHEVLTLTPEQAARLTDAALERWRSGETLESLLADPSSWRDGAGPVN